MNCSKGELEQIQDVANADCVYIFSDKSCYGE